jgi:tRNA(fMet)-specific endonuclease VapC
LKKSKFIIAPTGRTEQHQILNCFADQTAPTELAIPSIVVYEIEYGTLWSILPAHRRSQLEKGLNHIGHLPFDTEAARAAARIRVELEKRGAIIRPIEILIAGTALSVGALLLTNNTAEFSRVSGLRVTDWRF